MNNPLSARQIFEKSQKLGDLKPTYSFSGFLTAMSVFLTLLTSLLLPATVSQSSLAVPLAWITSIVCMVLFWFQGLRFIFIFIVSLTFIFSISVTGSPLIFALCFGSVLAVAFGALPICVGGRLQIALISVCPLLSFGMSFLITEDPILSALSLALYPTVFALAIAKRKKASANFRVLVSAIALILTLAIPSLLYLLVTYGSISASIIKNETDLFVTLALNLAKNMVSANGTVWTEPIQREFLSLINTYINLLSGFVCLFATVFAYISQSILNSVCKNYGLEDNNKISPSMLGAMIFTVAHTISFTTNASGEISFAATVCNNICLILLPAMFLVGIETIKMLPRRFGFFGLILIIALFIVIFTMSSSFVYMIAFVGTAYVIASSIDTWAKNFYKNKS